MKRTVLIVLTVFALAAFFLLRGRLPFLSKSDALRQAPDFELEMLGETGRRVSLSGIAEDHPVLLVFWASWCPSCVEEIPLLNKWQETYAPKGLRILSVNVQESAARIREFVRNQPIHYPILLDHDGRVADRYGLIGLPASVLLAKGGEIIYYGFSLPAHIDQAVE